MTAAPSLTDLVLWSLASSMAIVSSFAIKLTVEHRRVRGSLMVPFLVFVLVMMLSMVASAVVYFEFPGINTLVALVVVNMLVMGAGSLPFVLVIFHSLLAEEGRTPSQVPAGDAAPPSRRWEYPLVTYGVMALVLLNEFFMGWAFSLASGAVALSSTLVGPVQIFSSVVGSYWFLFTMSLEMALTTYLLRKEIRREYLLLVGLQSGVMFLSPTALDNPYWVAAGVFGGSALMIVLYIFAFEYLARNRMVESRLSDYLLQLMGAYALMMGGLYLWMLTGSELLFALAIVTEMVVYLSLVLGAGKKAGLMQWHSRPWWAFGLLTSLFVGEFFMGALIDAQVNGPQSLISLAGLVQPSGAPLAALGASVYDFISFFGAVTVSPWFLIMMGAEMGALVAFRIREVRELETKVRLGLVMVAYAVYAVFLPSFLIPTSVLPTIPFVGWSMGVGTEGPVAPALLLALGGTYLISGALSFLFGSRQVCSMFCTAALMYQGTFYDSMKTFNRTSTVGRKLLTSRLSGLYRWSFSLVWVSLFAAIGLSYLNSTGALDFAIFGADPAMFLYTFYFGFLWYLIFVSIPFVGTYACVTMGWCHWGTFNQLVSRLGFFKLKVRDPGVCVTCETKDCAVACPVGLTDLPGSFIEKGEFKSTKCIGVGDCVSACPYSNEYFFDVRNVLRRGRKKPKKGAVDLLVLNRRGPVGPVPPDN